MSAAAAPSATLLVRPGADAVAASAVRVGALRTAAELRGPSSPFPPVSVRYFPPTAFVPLGEPWAPRSDPSGDPATGRLALVGGPSSAPTLVLHLDEALPDGPSPLAGARLRSVALFFQVGAGTTLDPTVRASLVDLGYRRPVVRALSAASAPKPASVPLGETRLGPDKPDLVATTEFDGEPDALTSAGAVHFDLLRRRYGPYRPRGPFYLAAELRAGPTGSFGSDVLPAAALGGAEARFERGDDHLFRYAEGASTRFLPAARDGIPEVGEGGAVWTEAGPAPRVLLAIRRPLRLTFEVCEAGQEAAPNLGFRLLSFGLYYRVVGPEPLAGLRCRLLETSFGPEPRTEDVPVSPSDAFGPRLDAALGSGEVDVWRHTVDAPVFRYRPERRLCVQYEFEGGAGTSVLVEGLAVRASRRDRRCVL